MQSVRVGCGAAGDGGAQNAPDVTGFCASTTMLCFLTALKNLYFVRGFRMAPDVARALHTFISKVLASKVCIDCYLGASKCLGDIGDPCI